MPDETSETPRTKPTWLGNPLVFSTWVEEDPGGMLIVFMAVLNAPDARRSNWRKN